MNAGGTEVKQGIKIVMARSFDAFTDEAKNEFLAELSGIVGVPVEEFADVSFRRGCVVFRGKLDKHVAEALIALVEALDEGRERENAQIEELREFLKRHDVESVELDKPIKLAIAVPLSEARADVVFIHGWQSDPDCFGEVPRLLEERVPVKARFYGYPTGKLGKHPALSFVARNLENWLWREIRSERFGLVAHSMGGLIARKAVVQQMRSPRPRLDKRLKLMAFLASPHNGAALAGLAQRIPFVSTHLHDLGPNSSFLFDLNSDWLVWSKEMVPESCHVRCVVGVEDKIVSLANAQGLDPDAVPLLTANHSAVASGGGNPEELADILSGFIAASGHLLDGAA